jgi:predicted transcriptional regulator
MERKIIDSTLHVRLEPELRNRLEELAAREDRPLSSLVRRVLRAATREAETRGQAA